MGVLRRPALLESAPEFGAASRWSILAARPRLVFESRGTRCAVRTIDVESGRILRIERGLSPLETLGGLLARFGLAQGDDAPDLEGPPFQGGFIGYLGYDIAPLIERLPRRHPPDSTLPDIRLALYDTFAAVDHEDGVTTLIACDLVGDGPRATRERLADMRRALERERALGPSIVQPPLHANFSREAFVAAVMRALEYIAAGDIFQVNLSQRISAVARDAQPLDLYRRLKQKSPAPYAAFLRWGGRAIVSASPELFYETRGASIVTRPIKGTRPRGQSADQDRAQIEALRSSTKDRAELTMIVDLERNDLGRVCEYGSVRVVEPHAIESFAQVHHLVATVEGRLRDGVGPIDVVKAVAPGGSITGAPKIRAMQIIDELEPCRRGVYTGAIGYFSRGGRSAFNIAIRTLIVDGTRLSYQVGSGIVADSDPEAEYLETLHKGRGLREVLEECGAAR
jgi:para-aminobenzoate synthetase component 1